MGAHIQVRAPVSSSLVMCAHSTLSHILVLLLLTSTLRLVNTSDSETLLEFKDSLNNGNKLTTWNTSKSPCNSNTANWEGLLCTKGTVWGIKLEGMGLEGNIDTNILAKLPSLVTISFKNNRLEGAVPDFRKLDGMRDIFLSNNKFSGEISTNAFKGLKWLNKLYLANNKLHGQIPLSLTTLPKLQELMLQNNQFEGEIPNFEETRLTLANFANNHLHGRIPDGLQNLPASQFSNNEQLCGTPLKECRRVAVSTATIIVIAVVVATAVAAVIFAILILGRHQRQGPKEVQNQDSTIPVALANHGNLDKGHSKKMDPSMKLTFLRDDVERFNLPELLKASAEVLGSEMFGSSYKAALANGKVMVVKRFTQMNNVGKDEFYTHMRRLGKLRHPNILPLVAFYYRKEEKLLVSNYIDNISLALHLHGNRSNGVQRLDWPTRLKIVKGVAKGLLCLYNELPSLIVPHGHLKSSNVLLTKSYEPLLTEYGLAPVTNPEHAHDFMMAYKSPEYKQLHRISKRTDIWSLGILILEIMTGKFANTVHQGKGNDVDLKDFINSVADLELTIDMFDKEMGGFDKSNEREMMKLLKIGLSCCETNTDKRMDIKQVVERINEVKEKDYYSTYSSEWDK